MSMLVTLAAGLCLSLANPDPGGADVVAHWIFNAKHYSSGVFQPVEGGWPLAHAGPRFIGEGDTQCLFLPLEPQLMAAADKVEAAKLPREACSVEAWVALDTLPEWGGILSLIEDNGAAESGLLLGSRGRYFTFALSTKGTGDSDGLLTYLTGGEVIRTGRWYHVVGTYDGALQKLYVNGELAATSAVQSGEIFYSASHTLAVAAYKDRDEDFRLSGAMHQLTLFDGALRAKDIQRRYKKLAGKLPKPEGATFNSMPVEEATPLHVLQPAINKAIFDGVANLLREQHRDGSWSSYLGTYRNGVTGLAVYTLLKCGLRPDDPAVVAGLDFMRKKVPTKTYEAACQLLAIGATGDPANEEWAQEIVEILLKWESRIEPGGWAYPGGRVDLSNMQFVALAFWGASQLGVEVPVKVWRRMIKKTVEEHQTVIDEVEWPDDGSGQRRSGKRKIAGYRYFEERAPYHESGTMTTAGLCVIGLPEMLLGKKLGGQYVRMAAKSKQLGLGWLEEHYTEMWDGIGHAQQASVVGLLGDNLYYYLYGIERVGAFLGLERIGKHHWYRDGAEQLLKRQSQDGSWAVEKQTCFALLFLRRASAPRPSGEAAVRETGVFSDATGAVHIRATGNGRMTFWVEGFARVEQDKFTGQERKWRGLRVISVDYLANGELIATVPGDVRMPWKIERYAAQHNYLLPGAQTIQARVKILAAEGDPLDPHRTRTIESAILKIITKDSAEDWMRHNLEFAGIDHLSTANPVVSASSARDGYGAGLACDELHSTAWVCRDDDKSPWILFKLPRGTRANTVVLAQAGSKLSMRGKWGAIRKIQMRLNGGEPFVVDMGPDELRQVRVDLGKKLRIRELEIKILEFTKGKSGTGVGFSGVELRTQ